MASKSKSFLDNIFDAFSKWNFFKSHKSQIHPTLKEGLFRLPGDNSSTDSDNEQAVGLWQDFIEEYDCLLLDTKGQKVEMYLLENRPLIHQVVTGANLLSITEEHIKTYGLQMLNMVLDVICDPTVNRNEDSLEGIIQQMEQLDYAKWAGKKLIVWIEDCPEPFEAGDVGDEFIRTVLTEVMRRRIEPQMVIPCHDIDSNVKKVIKNVMQKKLLSTKEYADDELLDNYYETSMYLIALRIALASAHCNFVIIDANQLIIDTPVFRDLTEFATALGHEVMHLRQTPNTNRYLAVNELVDKIEEWARANNESLYINDNLDGLDDIAEELDEPRKGKDILHKLTKFHFTRKHPKGSSEKEDCEKDEKASDSSESGSEKTEDGLWKDEETTTVPARTFFDEGFAYEANYHGDCV